MRKTWMEPKIEAQQFMPNEYVASACGDENRVYKFICDAPGGPLYTDDGTFNGANYSPCARTHDAPLADEFVSGYIDYNRNRQEDEGEAVIVWIEPRWLMPNGHATTNLNMDSWITAKS